jgi:hypothetical protein
MNSSDDSSFNFSLQEEREAGGALKSAVDQLVGSNQKNDTKTRTPPKSRPQNKRKIKRPVFTSTRRSTGYLTVSGIQSETSCLELDWPIFALKESMDNGFDFLNDYYPNEGKESRNIAVCIKIQPGDQNTRRDILRLSVRNSNVRDVPVFENIDEIFDYNIWGSTKRNQHRMSCGSLGDFLKRVLGMGYASLTGGDNAQDSFEDRQWEEPIILRFNGKEVRVFLKVDRDTWTAWCDIQEPTLFNAPNFTEVEIALPVPEHWNQPGFLNGGISDKSMTVLDALAIFREVKCLPTRFKQMRVQELASNGKEIQALYNALKNGMEAETKFKLPYKRKAREIEIIKDIAEDYDIDVEKAKSRVVTGQHDDGVRKFNYAIEIAVAPRKGIDENVLDAGKVDFIGNINDSPSIDGGEGYFSGGSYQWTDPKTGYSLSATNIRNILSECGFNATDYVSKRRVPSVVYLNLKTPVPDWLGAAGKTQVNLNPYANKIAQNLADLAKKMPSYHGKGYAAKVVYSYSKDPTQEGKNYIIDFLKERRAAVQANPSI